MNEPDELLHIAMPDDWTKARDAGEYRVSSRNKSLDDEGFIHCSYPRQIELVANRFYSDVAELVLLHLEPELLEAEIKIEPATEDGTEMYPHVYGPIPTAAVIATTWWDRDEDGMWHKPTSM